MVSHVLDPQPVLSPAEYDALESPSEAFRKVTSEDILKMIEENRYWWADGVSVSHDGKRSDRKQDRAGTRQKVAPSSGLGGVCSPVGEGASFTLGFQELCGFKEEERVCVWSP